MFYNLLYPLHEQFQLFNLFQYITVRAGGALFTALVLSWLIGPGLIDRFRSFQHKHKFKTVRDHMVAEHVVAKQGTPTMGGVLILGTLVTSTLLWADMTNAYVLVTLLVVLGFGIMGFIDDYLSVTGIRKGGMPGRVRLLIGAAIALTAAFIVQYIHQGPQPHDLFVPYLKNVVLPLGLYGFLTFSVLVVVGSANGVNLTDGLDGLATVPAMLVALSFAAIAYIVGRTDFTGYLGVYYVPGVGELAVFCAALVGACLGFLWFNAPPARIFMGDTGSLAMGAGLGIIAVMLKMELVLAIVGGIFVLETLSVMLQVSYFKMTKGKRLFKMAPLHHHFERSGWAESTIVIRFWIISIVFALIGLSSLKLR